MRYSLQCARFLASMDIDMLVIACNTASAHAIPALKDEFHIPVIGVVEAGRQGCNRVRRKQDRGHRHLINHQEPCIRGDDRGP
ncbi:MAG: aspartate/glutamate racemase family protein [Candidatus Moduliflexus flocculans]|nr:aspartate/glutamate racemase family protein [Candidatus Moduliflexus flocculans]